MWACLLGHAAQELVLNSPRMRSLLFSFETVALDPAAFVPFVSSALTSLRLTTPMVGASMPASSAPAVL